MDESRRVRSLYPYFVWAFFLVGAALNVLILCSALDNVIDFPALTPLGDFFDHREAAELLILVFLVGAGLGLITLIIYAASLDPFRSDRPRGLVYLNFFPMAFYVGVVTICSSVGANDLPALPEVALGLALGFLMPVAVIVSEAMLARLLLALGSACDARGWSGPAFFCFKNSLRWRPSVHETARRSGLLLAELGRFGEARGLLERLATVSTSEDPEVLRALDQVYSAQSEDELAFQCLERLRALLPDSLGLERRYLNRCLALERWEQAISVLESGKIKLDIELLVRLQELYLKTGNIAQALSRARQIAELEPPPYPRSIALHADLLDRMPENIDLLIDFGLLLQKTEISEEMQRGARQLELALKLDPRRSHLRRRLAGYYRDTLQHLHAEEHYQRLVDEGDPDPETYLNFADVLKSELRREEALEILRKMQAICSDDWRGFAEEAKMLLESGRVDDVSQALAESRRRAPDEVGPELDQLDQQLSRLREEIDLQAISEELQGDGVDLRKRVDFIKHLLTLDRGEKVIAECDALLEERSDMLPEIERLIEEGLPEVEHAYRLRDYLADLYFTQERYEEMLDLFAQMARSSLQPEKVLENGCMKILARAPDHLPSRMALSEVYRESGQWEKMMRALNPLMDSAPEEQLVRIKALWTEAAFEAGKFEKALHVGMEILDQMRGEVQFLTLMIRVLEDNGDYQQAYELYKVAAEAFPEDEALQSLGATVADNKKRNRMEVLQELAEQEMLTTAQHYEKADLHREFGQIQFAMAHYQCAAEDAEVHDVAMSKLATCLCERRMFELADETLDSIELTKDKIARHRELKNLFYRVADVLEYEGFREAALKYFKRLFRVDASFRDVVNRLERLGGH